MHPECVGVLQEKTKYQSYNKMNNFVNARTFYFNQVENIPVYLTCLVDYYKTYESVLTFWPSKLRLNFKKAPFLF